MKISFVIPAYNEEAYLGGCLDSIFHELEKHPCQNEIVVVDNASTDNTGKIARGYKGVKVVYEPKKGLTRARQAGFLNSDGELVANIDADTRLTPGWLETVFSEFVKNEKLVALSGPFVLYDMPTAVNVLAKIFYGLGFLTYLLNKHIFKISSMLQGGNFVVKRSALKSVGGFDTDIDFYGEDTDVARRLSKVGDVKFTFKLPIYSSGRRVAKEGIFKTGLRYAANYFWVSFAKKPLTKTSTDIRPADESGKNHFAYVKSRNEKRNSKKP